LSGKTSETVAAIPSDILTDGRKGKRADELAAKPVVLRGEDIAWTAVDVCRSFS